MTLFYFIKLLNKFEKERKKNGEGTEKVRSYRMKNGTGTERVPQFSKISNALFRKDHKCIIKAH